MLTDNQKDLIRIMVSENPSVTNMERIGNMDDATVLAELHAWVPDRLSTKKAELAEYIKLVDTTQAIVNKLEEENGLITTEGSDVGDSGDEGTVGDGVSETPEAVSGVGEEGSTET
jgi:hypothetical protein